MVGGDDIVPIENSPGEEHVGGPSTQINYEIGSNGIDVDSQPVLLDKGKKDDVADMQTGSCENKDEFTETVDDQYRVALRESAEEEASSSYQNKEDDSMVMEKLKRRLKEEHDIAVTTVTPKNVIGLAQKHIIRRSVRQHELMTKSLNIASKCIDSKRMLEHLTKVTDNLDSSREPNKRLETKNCRQQINDYENDLIAAVRDSKLNEITDVHSALEVMMLKYDSGFLETIQGDKLKFRDAVRENRPPRNSPPWHRRPLYRFLSLLKGDFRGEKSMVTLEEQHWFISRGSWTLAIICMFVAISFLTYEFVEARKEPALSTNVIRYERMQLPVIYACLTIPFIPMYENFPTSEYMGWPTWGLRSYTNFETNETLIYPETKKKISEAVILGPDTCKNEMQYMSNIPMRGLCFNYQNPAHCYSCLRIGRKKPDVIEHSKSMHRAAGAVTLEFSILEDLKSCFSVDSADVFFRNEIQKELVKHKEKFIERDVVELSDPSIFGIEDAILYGFNVFQVHENAQRTALQMTVFCNLYLLSGVFYPVKPEDQVRYNFDLARGRNAWRKIGDPKKFLNIRAKESDSGKADKSAFFDELYMRGDALKPTYFGIETRIFTVPGNSTAEPTFKDFSATLAPLQESALLYKKEVKGGVNHISSVFHRGPKRVFMVKERFRRFNVSLDFSSFHVEVSEKVPTTTIAEYLADISEYIGLFTGFCAYSMIVSPARMYIRRLKRTGDAPAENN